MIVGLLSDTHGQHAIAKAGIAMLRLGGAQVLIHSGDVGGTDILDLLAGDVPAYFVFGNNDWDREELQSHAGRVGVTCLGVAGDVPLGGRVAVVLHGDVHSVKRQALGRGDVAYVFQGHTHVPKDERVGDVRVINPGALHRAAVKTVALLNTEDGALRYLRVTK